jgi:DDE domain
MRTRPRPAPVPRSAFAGFRFPPDVIVVAVRWYLRFGLSYRDVEELLAERGIEADHVTIYRWVQRFTPLLAEAARPCRHAVGDRWFVDETYVKVAAQWRYVYRAVDQFGQVIDVFVSAARHHGGPPVLPAGHRHDQGSAGGGRHRPGSDLSDGARGVATRGVAPNRAVGQQPGRGRPWPAEGAAATNAGAQAGRQRQGDHCRAWLHAEPPARALRAGRRGTSESASGGRLRRARGRNLIRRCAGLQHAAGWRNATDPKWLLRLCHEQAEKQQGPTSVRQAVTLGQPGDHLWAALDP